MTPAPFEFGPVKNGSVLSESKATPAIQTESAPAGSPEEWSEAAIVEEELRKRER